MSSCSGTEFFLKALDALIRLRWRCFIRVHLWLKLANNSSGLAVAVPTLPTTIPAA